MSTGHEELGFHTFAGQPESPREIIEELHAAEVLHGLTGGRFVLGMGRGILAMQRAHGIAPITTAQLEHIAGLIPEDGLSWSATGRPEQYVAAVRPALDLGCDGVILQGATPTKLVPIVEAYQNAR